MPESNDVCRRRPLLLIFLLAFSIIPFGTTSAWTPPSPGTVETFDDGNTTIETMFPSAGVFRPTNFSIPRNTTVTAASFNLDVNGSSTDVGPTRIDIGEDGNIQGLHICSEQYFS